MKKTIYIASLLVGILCAITSCSSVTNEGARDDNRGKKIIETGELSAVDTRAFVLQRYGRYWYRMKIIGILKQGEEVHSGDSVIQLDPTEIKKYIVDAESQLETQKATISKMLVDMSNKRSELQSNLKNEQASFDLKKLEMQSIRFESEKIRRIKELEFKQAEITLNMAKRKIELYEIIARNELKVQRINEQQYAENIKSARDIMPKLTIRTPIDGIFQLGRNEENGQMLKIGDQIWVGNMMGNVPNLKWMKVNTCVNENDFLRVKAGQKVTVRLDALPKVAFKGEVSYVGKFCKLKDNKSKQKVFDVEVKMLQSDERLKPGMTVSCEYLEK